VCVVCCLYILGDLLKTEEENPLDGMDVDGDDGKVTGKRPRRRRRHLEYKTRKENAGLCGVF
jgi:hypothetical protein